ncbi:WG repeat-containing protein [Pedobacter caeni]|nr:WG repeat-containing protein [Pedobacter caeni]
MIILTILWSSVSTVFAQPFSPDSKGYVADPKFKELIKERRYELVGSFSPSVLGKHACFIKNGEKSYLDTMGNEVPDKSIFTRGLPIKKSERLKNRFFSFIDGTKYGMKDRNGRVEIPAIYDRLEIYKDSIVYVRLNKKLLGFLLVEGAFQGYNNLDLVYDAEKYDGCVSRLPDLFVKKQDDKYALFNAAGEALSPYVYLEKPMGFAQSEFGEIQVLEGKVRKYGIIDTLGKTRLAPVYNDIEMVGMGGVYITRSFKGGDDRVALLDAQLNPLSKSTYSEIGVFNHDGLAVVSLGRDKTLRKGIVNTAGHELVKPMYQFLELSGKFAKVIYKGKQKVIDSKGKTVIPSIYDDLIPINDGSFKADLFYVSLKDKWGVLNAKAQVVLPIVCDNMPRIDINNQVFIYSINKKTGIRKLNGEVILKPTYDKFYTLDGTEGNLNIVKIGPKYGISDDKGVLILPLKYDSIIQTKTNEPYWRGYNGMIEAVLNNRPCTIDLYGNEYFKGAVNK